MVTLDWRPFIVFLFYLCYDPIKAAIVITTGYATKGLQGYLTERKFLNFSFKKQTEFFNFIGFSQQLARTDKHLYFYKRITLL